MALPQPNSRYSPSCDSRLAEGLIRGFYVGALWGALFHRYEDVKAAGEMTPSVNPSQLRWDALRLRFVGTCKHAALLGTFLGLYSGSSCVAEKLLGKRSWGSTFLGGFTAGSFAGFTTGRPGNALTWGMGTGIASVIVFGLQSS